MAVYSRYPIDPTGPHVPDVPLEGHARRPLPDDPGTPAPEDWYSPAELDVFRLSSKSHWDLPIQIGDKVSTSW